MFNKSAVQAVSTRSQAKKLVTSGDENIKSNHHNHLAQKSTSTSNSVAPGQARKRRALGDVSNNQPPHATTNLALKSTIKHAKSTNIKPTTTTTTTINNNNNNNIKRHVVSTAQTVPKESSDELVKRQKIAQTTSTSNTTINNKNWDDLDSADFEDPVMVSEYVSEIFDHLYQQELKMMPDANYMLKQKDLQWKMRSILIDWLVEVHQKFKLLPETLFLAVNIIDRFLSIRAVSLNKLQLVGVTSLFISAKYEEVFAPSINQFVYITDGGFSSDEIIKAERFILATLSFNLQYPNPLNFLRRISKADGYCLTTRTMGKYLMEITLLDEAFLLHSPSMIAAASMYISRRVFSSGSWDSNLVHYSGYEEQELETCVTKMISFLHRETQLEAVYSKYSSEKNLEVALTIEKWMEQCVEARDFDMPWI